MRRAAAEDLDLVTRMTIAAYKPHTDAFGYPPIPVIEDYAPRIAAGEVWIDERDGEPVGLAVVETHADHVMLFSLVVAPVHQGQGLGRAMLGWLEGFARDRAKPEIRLYTNARMLRNIALYTSAGFIETDRRTIEGPPRREIVSMARSPAAPHDDETTR